MFLESTNNFLMWFEKLTKFFHHEFLVVQFGMHSVVDACF